MADLLLDMTKPCHGMGKAVMGECGFCVTKGMLDVGTSCKGGIWSVLG